MNGKNVKLLVVGKAPGDVAKLCADASKSAGVEVIEVPDLPDREVSAAVRKEGEALLSKIDKSDKVVLFDIEGDSSFDAARRLAKTSANTVFVVGGSNGVSDAVRQRADMRVSVSGLTFPHGLFRLLALELLKSL